MKTLNHPLVPLRSVEITSAIRCDIQSDPQYLKAVEHHGREMESRFVGTSSHFQAGRHLADPRFVSYLNPGQTAQRVGGPHNWQFALPTVGCAMFIRTPDGPSLDWLVTSDEGDVDFWIMRTWDAWTSRFGAFLLEDRNMASLRPHWEMMQQAGLMEQCGRRWRAIVCKQHPWDLANVY